MPAISFFVQGDPKGQPRPRAFARKTASGFVARVYDAGTAEGWKSAVAEAARPFLGQREVKPLNVSLAFYFRRPKIHFRSGKNSTGLKPGAPLWHTSRPDCDNLAKAVLDALVVIGLIADD